jgi:hypothetical protein
LEKQREHEETNNRSFFIAVFAMGLLFGVAAALAQAKGRIVHDAEHFA